MAKIPTLGQSRQVSNDLPSTPRSMAKVAQREGKALEQLGAVGQHFGIELARKRMQVDNAEYTHINSNGFRNDIKAKRQELSEKYAGTDYEGYEEEMQEYMQQTKKERIKNSGMFVDTGAFDIYSSGAIEAEGINTHAEVRKQRDIYYKEKDQELQIETGKKLQLSGDIREAASEIWQAEIYSVTNNRMSKDMNKKVLKEKANLYSTSVIDGMLLKGDTGSASKVFTENTEEAKVIKESLTPKQHLYYLNRIKTMERSKLKEQKAAFLSGLNNVNVLVSSGIASDSKHIDNAAHRKNIMSIPDPIRRKQELEKFNLNVLTGKYKNALNTSKQGASVKDMTKGKKLSPIELKKHRDAKRLAAAADAKELKASNRLYWEKRHPELQSGPEKEFITDENYTAEQKLEQWKNRKAYEYLKHTKGLDSPNITDEGKLAAMVDTINSQSILAEEKQELLKEHYDEFTGQAKVAAAADLQKAGASKVVLAAAQIRGQKGQIIAAANLSDKKAAANEETYKKTFGDYDLFDTAINEDESFTDYSNYNRENGGATFLNDTRTLIKREYTRRRVQNVNSEVDDEDLIKDITKDVISQTVDFQENEKSGESKLAFSKTYFDNQKLEDWVTLPATKQAAEKPIDRAALSFLDVEYDRKLDTNQDLPADVIAKIKVDKLVDEAYWRSSADGTKLILMKNDPLGKDEEVYKNGTQDRIEITFPQLIVLQHKADIRRRNKLKAERAAQEEQFHMKASGTKKDIVIEGFNKRQLDEAEAQKKDLIKRLKHEFRTDAYLEVNTEPIVDDVIPDEFDEDGFENADIWSSEVPKL